jgi:hypothetical protein
MSDSGTGQDNDTPVESEDVRFATQAMELASRDPTCARMNTALMLLQEGLMLVPKSAWPDVFPNNLAALACLARAYRQLRGAFTLTIWGYCAEARVLLRSAYESAALARMLGKDPSRAEKWIRKQHWFPDREVRAWFADAAPNSVSSPEEILSTYGAAYKHSSALAHPTAIACVSALHLDEESISAQLATVFSEDDFRNCTIEVAATTIFACFALRNAAVNEGAIDPEWRRRLYDLAREMSDSDMPHLERDWAEEQSKYEDLQRRIQSADGLFERLRKDPRSWDNLQRKGGE